MNVPWGQKLASAFLIAFGLLILLVAMFTYGVALFGLIALVLVQASADRTPLVYILGLIVVGLFINAAGQSMIFTGDYMRGRMRAIREKTILLSCSFCIIRDLFFVLTGIFFIVALVAFSVSDWVFFSSSAGVVMGFCCVVMLMKRRIASLSEDEIL